MKGKGNGRKRKKGGKGNSCDVIKGNQVTDKRREWDLKRRQIGMGEREKKGKRE